MIRQKISNFFVKIVIERRELKYKLMKGKIINKNHYHWQIPLLITLILVGVNIFTGFSLGNFILILTLFAILWYSFETRELKNVTQKQLEPILFLYLVEQGDCLEISNIGKTPVSNVFINSVKLGDYKFEFNLLKPISHIIPGEKYKIDITRSVNLTRQFNQSVDELIADMKQADVKKIELVLEYDTFFKTNEKTIFVLEIPGLLSNENDPIRSCKIYLK